MNPHPLDTFLIDAAVDGDPAALMAVLTLIGESEKVHACTRLGRLMPRIKMPWNPKGAMARRSPAQGGASALIGACDHGRVDCAKILLPMSDPWALDAHGRSASELAARRGSALILRALARAPVKGDSQQIMRARQLGVALLHACRLGFASCAQEIIDAGKVDLSSRDELGRDALMSASREGHFECVELLARASPEMAKRRDPSGATALMIAAMAGADRCVKALLHVSDAAARDNERCTAKIHAERHGKAALAKVIGAAERQARLAGMAMGAPSLSTKGPREARERAGAGKSR